MIAENEYDFDSSDEEDVQNTIGNIPLEWYNKSLHMGYDITGRPLMKPSSSMIGALDSFLNNVENADNRMIIKDPVTGQNVIISESDILAIKGLSSSRGFLSTQINDDDYVTDWFTRDVMETPLTCHPPQKSSFIPSKLDKKRVSRMVYSIKMGRMKMPEAEDRDKVMDSDYDYIMGLIDRTPNFWSKDYNKQSLKHVSAEDLEWLPKELHPDYQTKYQALRQIIRPPPEPLPGHAESYNPPKEYLLNDKEKQIFLSRFFDPSYNPCRLRGEKPIVPKVYQNLRSVPYSTAPIIERQKRLRDIAFAARVVKEKVNSSTEKMLSQNIPSYTEMRPYPNLLDRTVTTGDVVLSISVTHCGDYIATIGYEYIDIYRSLPETGNLHHWRRYPISSNENNKSDRTLRNPSLSWNPHCYLLAVAVDNKITIINPALDVSSESLDSTVNNWWVNSTTNSNETEEEEPSSKKTKLTSNWSIVKHDSSSRLQKQFTSLVIDLEENVLDMSWHSCGDYLLTICGKGKSTNSGGKVQLHRLSKCATQSPFGSSNKHVWLAARFHCQKNVPLLFLAECNSSNIQVFDMVQKKLVKTLQVTGHPSTIEMHPTENHLVVGTFEGKLCWFDLDMGVNPFKTLNVNRNSIRSVAFHQNYPLMSCTTSNGSVVVFYAKVFNTYENNPIVVPVSLFEKLDKCGDMYSICFHTREAKVYCGGADQTIKPIVACH